MSRVTDGAWPVVRVAAALHIRPKSSRRFRHSLAEAAGRADVLLIGGDLTDTGSIAEARLAAEDLSDLPVPMVCVTGNHDHHHNQVRRLVEVLTEAGVTVLDGTSTVVDCRGLRVGVAGCKGFGGGFGAEAARRFGEPQVKAFARRGEESAAELRSALGRLNDVDVKVVLTHYAPHESTLVGEPPQVWPFLGCGLLGKAIDADGGVALAVHGHAHHGCERGATDGGVPVRNVAYSVIRTGYRLYLLHQLAGRWTLRDPGPTSTAK